MRKLVKLGIPILTIAFTIMLLVSISSVNSTSPISAKLVNSGGAAVAVGESRTVYVFVTNANPISDVFEGWTLPAAQISRDDVPGAFVLTRLTMQGVDPDGTIIYTWSPGPDGTYTSGRWPQTIYNPDGTTITIKQPAVLPGETVAIFFVGFTNDGSDPGRFITIFTIEGTVNGNDITPITLRIIINYK